MKRLLILILFISLFTPASAVADCTTSACVEVFTQDNQIIITAKKGDGGAVVKSAQWLRQLLSQRCGFHQNLKLLLP